MKNENQPIHSFAGTDHNTGNFNGLTKREYFAALAMQGFLSGVYASKEMHDRIKDVAHSQGLPMSRFFSELIIQVADDLLAELEKTKDQ